MSYILDALKKSEEMRSRNKSNNLFSAQVTPSPQITHRGYIGKLLFVLSLIISSLFFLYWLHNKKPSPSIPTPQKPIDVSLRFDNVISAINENDTQPLANTIERDRDRVPDNIKSESKNMEKPSIEISDKNEIKPVNINKKGTINDTKSLAEPAPISKHDSSTKTTAAQIPIIVIAMHMYSDTPANRLVQINDKVLKEGEEIGPHFKLVKITPKGVVLNYMGEEFSKTLTINP